jgi:hypothetical protein
LHFAHTIEKTHCLQNTKKNSINTFGELSKTGKGFFFELMELKTTSIFFLIYILLLLLPILSKKLKQPQMPG